MLAYQGMTNQLSITGRWMEVPPGINNAYVIPGTTSSPEYYNFGGDIYSWADPHGDTIAFTLEIPFRTNLLMKSTDNGTTWTKTSRLSLSL